MPHIHRIRSGNVNVHIIEDGPSAVLVDTGRREHLDHITEVCRHFRIRLIVLTHGHFDHAENALQLSDRLGAPIAMNAQDLNLVADNTAQPMYASTLAGRLVLAASERAFRARPVPQFHPEVFLQDGDSLAPYGVAASVIALPGHTRGSVGLDVDGTDVLVGDALMHMFRPSLSLLYGDRTRMLESARRVTELGDRMIHFGHGGPVQNRIWLR